MYDNSSVFWTSLFVKTRCFLVHCSSIGVSRCLIMPFFVGFNSYIQLKHKFFLQVFYLVFIGFLSKKSSIKGGFLIARVYMRTTQLLHLHVLIYPHVFFVSSVSSRNGLGFFQYRFWSCFSRTNISNFDFLGRS